MYWQADKEMHIRILRQDIMQNSYDCVTTVATIKKSFMKGRLYGFFIKLGKESEKSRAFLNLEISLEGYAIQTICHTGNL